jgi:hypothetical protein
MYYPLSQITPNLTSNGEFSLLSNGNTYIGNYYATSDGNYYTGNTPQSGPNEPLALKEINNQQIDQFGNTSLSSGIVAPLRYQNSISIPMSQALPPSTITPYPTKEEYNTGEFVRYFLKKTNTPLYLEVNKQTYNNYNSKLPSTQHQIFIPFRINWELKGNPIEVYRTNKNIVLLTETQQNLFGFDFYFKGKFVKYFVPTPSNFYNTTGGELKVETTNDNYAGFYHVNSNRGIIMEGKSHKPTLHNTLIPFEEGEVAGKVKMGMGNEVGTSIRKNTPRNSGY